ncbi:restriction endonuclease subunit S [Arthrobacter sp. BPSS-3]|uniref:restriction endonuclease subunit S n=1 Tax=Arthrobacter sp. BPSS-3 TaxID=3366580 RepID=UPI0037DD39B6
MSSYVPYKAYKASHVAWLDEIPAHWSVSSLRWLSTRYSGGTPDRENPDFWSEGSIPWLNSGAVNEPVIHKPSAYISETGFASSSAKWIPQGALVLALAGQGKTKGTVAQLGFSATCNQSMAALIPTGRVDARYLFWWLRSNYTNVRSMSGGDLRDGLNLQLLGDIPVPLPSPNEQRAIVDFLDRETAQIDELIIKQERLIELLVEKRQAIITHAVTKGLDPTAPTKPSGIPWLGDMPNHWTTSRLKWTGPTQESGTSVNGMDTPAGPDELGVLKTGAVSKGYFVPEANKTVLPEDVERVTCPVRMGTLIVNRANTPDLVGSTGRTPNDAPLLFLSDKLWQIDFERAHTDFIYWWSKTDVYRSQIQFRRVGASSSMQNLSYPDFLTVDIALPSLEEQQITAGYLDDRTASIDLLKDKAQSVIVLLRERRSALISAAVTGKIDVREGVA